MGGCIAALIVYCETKDSAVKMTQMTIVPENVCADRILVTLENGVIRDVVFEGGCEGNGKALARLLKGMDAEKAMELLKGVDCEGKGTSCADQFSRGLKKIAALNETAR